MHLVEVQRGCPNHCLFCAAPVVYSPLIQFSKKDIIEAIDEGLPHRKKIGLIGGDILAHPDFIEIVEHIHGRGATFSPSSLRADRITDQIARLLNDSGHKTITLAPETGSEILRKRIGKNIKDEAFFQARDLLMSNGVAQFKLYFMIGLPGESDEELLEIANFVTRFRLKEIKRLTLTINSFVPKRKTPFSTQKLIEPADYRRKVGLLKKAIHKIGGISFKIEPYSTATREFEFHNL